MIIAMTKKIEIGIPLLFPVVKTNKTAKRGEGSKRIKSVEGQASPLWTKYTGPKSGETPTLPNSRQAF